jgi:hypothetical protein
METCKVSEGIAPPFLTSALDAGELSASSPYRFAPGETISSNHWIGGWGRPQSWSEVDGEENGILSYRESNPDSSVVKPVAWSLYNEQVPEHAYVSSPGCLPKYRKCKCINQKCILRQTDVRLSAYIAPLAEINAALIGPT